MNPIHGNVGWKCPCCNVVYAPHVSNCRCQTMPMPDEDFLKLQEKVQELDAIRHQQTAPGYGPVMNPDKHTDFYG